MQEQPQHLQVKQVEEHQRDKKIGHLIHEGLDGQISLIGFPYSVGAGIDGIYKGQENGPDCLRRFLTKVGSVVNPEYEISIEDMTFSDYGNIQIDSREKCFPKILEKLSAKVKSALSKKNIPIVIGGTRDLAQASTSSFLSIHQGSIISVCSHLDMKKYKNVNDIGVSNVMRKIVEDNQQTLSNSKSKLICFGSQSSDFFEEESELVKLMTEVIEVIPLSQTRRYQVVQSDSIFKPSTQACQHFEQILQGFPEDKPIHLSFSLESINSSYCPGVTRTSVIGGLTGEEVIEMVFFAGSDKRFKSVDFTDFNPSNEDFRTGILLAQLIYYFSMGVRTRYQVQQV